MNCGSFIVSSSASLGKMSSRPFMFDPYMKINETILLNYISKGVETQLQPKKYIKLTASVNSVCIF